MFFLEVLLFDIKQLKLRVQHEIFKRDLNKPIMSDKIEFQL